MLTANQVIVWAIVIAFAGTYAVAIGAMTGKIKVRKQHLSTLILKVVLPVTTAALFLFYSVVRAPTPPPPYSGEWKAAIYWYPSYAQTLFNYGNADPHFHPVNPRSEGSLYFYVSRDGVYKGFSIWETKNGEYAYSRLAVLPNEFEFDSSGTLKSLSLGTAFRVQLRPFSYGPFTRYKIRFTSTSGVLIQGKMIAYPEGNEVEVGDVVLERE